MKNTCRGSHTIIVDTDMGSDDWLALLFLLKCDAVSVEAVTVTGTGLSHIGPGVRNLMDLALAADKGDTMVAIGGSQPLCGESTFPNDWRAQADRFLGVPLPRNTGQPVARSAVDILVDIAQRDKTSISIVALAPLTNLAQAIQRESRVFENIETLFVMGGALRVPGNAPNQQAEWNIYIDPLAASVVLSSAANITLIPLDATDQVPVTMEFYHRLQKEQKTPAARLVFEILTAELDSIKAGEYFFWDSLAAAVAVDASLVATERLAVRVVTEGFPDSVGRTVVVPGGSTVINVCTAVNRPAFEDRFIDVINSTG